MSKEIYREIVLENLRHIHLIKDAIFYAEKWVIDSNSEESVYYLALAYFRDGQYRTARHILNASKRSSRIIYLLAQCNFALTDYVDTEKALCELFDSAKTFNVSNVETRNSGDDVDIAAAYCLFGQACKKLNRFEQAAAYFKKALLMKPLMLSAIEGMASLGAKAETDKQISEATIQNQMHMADISHESNESLENHTRNNVPNRDKKRSRNESTKPDTQKESQPNISKTHSGKLSSLANFVRVFWKALQLFHSYLPSECINTLSQLPTRDRNHVFVQSLIAKSHVENLEYSKAEKCFRRIRRIQPYRVADMDIYSTILWQLKKSFELNALSQFMHENYRLAAQSWVCLGNSCSLLQDQESAFKSFKRAIQIDPDYAYAHNLLGHELHASESGDIALKHFRIATRLEPRLYNAWYGMGVIYFKQERWQAAEFHIRKAISVNKNSPVLYSQLGLILHKFGKFEEALVIYDRAIQINLRNPVARYRKASTLISLGRNKEALKELEVVQDIAPKEVQVYFKIGQLYKELGDRQRALKFYTLALDNHSQNYPLIKEAIDSIYA